MGSILFLVFLATQRLTELWLANANTQALLAQGAREYGSKHYPILVMLQSSWVACLVLFGFGLPVSAGWLFVFIMVQLVRVWILASLGGRWTTRIIVLDEPLVVKGPYKYLRHPNYLMLIVEMFVAPMVLGLFWLAVIFSVLNALCLLVWISVENRALAHLR